MTAPREPGGACPVCDGEGGKPAEACPAYMGEWTPCPACDGSGEWWPELVPYVQIDDGIPFP